MKLERASYEHYWQKGWVVEGFFDAGQVDRMGDLALSLSQAESSDRP